MEPTLLIAEDDPELTAMYHHYLSRCGYQVLTASVGIECLSIIRNDSPFAIVVSVDLPWGDAGGLVEYLREQSRRCVIPSVILTGSTADENVAALREEPCVFRYLRKPFLMVKLLKCIRTIESDCEESVRPALRLRPQPITTSNDFCDETPSQSMARKPEAVEPL